MNQLRVLHLDMECEAAIRKPSCIRICMGHQRGSEVVAVGHWEKLVGRIGQIVADAKRQDGVNDRSVERQPFVIVNRLMPGRSRCIIRGHDWVR